MNKVAIYVNGGVIQAIIANTKDVEVEIFDVDNLKEEFSGEEIDKMWDKIQEELPESL
jgi:hypothetical protein